jgi:hypothetical protein
VSKFERIEIGQFTPCIECAALRQLASRLEAELAVAKRVYEKDVVVVNQDIKELKRVMGQMQEEIDRRESQ